MDNNGLIVLVVAIGSIVSSSIVLVVAIGSIVFIVAIVRSLQSKKMANLLALLSVTSGTFVFSAETFVS